MSTGVMFLLILLGWSLVSILFSLALSSVTNGRLEVRRYFLVCFLTTFVFAIGIGILDLLSQSMGKDKKASSLPSTNNRPKNLGENEYYVDKGSKRIKVLESELESYIGDGWEVVTFNNDNE